MKSNQRRTGAVSGMNRTYRGARIGAMYGTAGKKKPARRGLSARLIMILGGVALAGALVLLAIFRRSEYKKHRSHPYEEADSASEERVYDVDSEEFTSFYDQFRTQE